MNEFLTLTKAKEKKPENEVNEIVSFHYSKLVSIQQQMILVDTSGDVISSTEIFVSEYQQPIKVQETNKQIIEKWEECRENFNERIKARALGILK